MKTIKIIDLLNKIANGEEVPEHIKIGKNEWYFYKSRNTYGDKKSAWIVWDWYVEENRLNDEVEILKEPKKIPEKLYRCSMETDNEEIKFLIKNINDLAAKINEILVYLETKGE